MYSILAAKLQGTQASCLWFSVKSTGKMPVFLVTFGREAQAGCLCSLLISVAKLHIKSEKSGKMAVLLANKKGREGRFFPIMVAKFGC